MGYSTSEAKNFISKIAPIIKEEGNKRGYNIVSTTIAQAIIEGAAGTSTLAKLYHNHFGMKCGKSWKGKSVNLRTKEEYTVGNLVNIYDNFRVYDNDIEGVKGYYDFISAKRYNNLKNAKNYRQFAEYLKLDEYATSSKYVNTLCSTVDKYGLISYDTNTSVEFFPKYTGISTSIVEALNSMGIDSGYESREEIYSANYGAGYKGSAKQNTDMVNRLKSGKLIKP